MQAMLAIIGFFSSLAAWAGGADIAWALAGGLLFIVVPFTILVILPTNKMLLAPAAARDTDAALRLLRRWGWLHAVRTVVSAVSFALFLVLLARRL